MPIDLPPELAGMTPSEIISRARKLRALRGRLSSQVAAQDDAAERERASEDLIDCPSPVTYAREVLGIEPWARQVEILESVAGAHRRIAVRSGHKISKTLSAAVIALWWVKTKKNGRVIVTSHKDLQVREVFWREFRQCYQRARRPLGGVIHLTPRHGLQYPDGRQVIGFTSKDVEGFGGWSGAEILFLVDEASGVDDHVIEAIEGNLAGGGKVMLLGNPLRTSGQFYRAFTAERSAWHRIHISSEESPNVTGIGPPIEGLATRQWVEEYRQKLGPDYEKSPVYQVRVRGSFPTQVEDAVIGLLDVEVAVARHATALEDGPLEVGVDPARFGDDETVAQPRRGKKALGRLVLRAMDSIDVAGKVVEHIRGLVRKDAAGAWLERPRVKVDVIGIGAGVYDVLRRNAALEVLAVNVSEAPTALPEKGEPGYALLRDQLWFATRDWLRAGGAIDDDPLLAQDLVAPRYGFTPGGDYKVESKLKIKQRLGRSPDRADALGLAIYNPPPKPRAEIARVPWGRR